jgi:hypothetical protein
MDIMLQVANETNAIRARARGVNVASLLAGHCPTCAQPAGEPFRRTVGGVVVEGCVDAHHVQSADAWWRRDQAHDIRRAALAPGVAAG